MTTSRVSNIIDLDAHIFSVLRDYLLESYPQVDAVTTWYDYSGVRFESQISYHTDQLIPNEQMDTIDHLEQTNNTSLIQPMQIRREEEVTNSYSWSSEHGFSVGVSISASFRVPFVGGLDTTVETSYSFASSSSQTEGRTRKWDFSQTVNVAPYTRVVAILMIAKTQPRIPYTLHCAMAGEVRYDAMLYKNRQFWGMVDGSTSIAWVLSQKPLAQFSASGATAYFQSNGTFVASEGIKAIVDLNEYPLAGENRTAKHHVIDLTPGMTPRVAMRQPQGE